MAQCFKDVLGVEIDLSDLFDLRRNYRSEMEIGSLSDNDEMKEIQDFCDMWASLLRRNDEGMIKQAEDIVSEAVRHHFVDSTVSFHRGKKSVEVKTKYNFVKSFFATT